MQIKPINRNEKSAEILCKSRQNTEESCPDSSQIRALAADAVRERRLVQCKVRERERGGRRARARASREAGCRERWVASGGALADAVAGAIQVWLAMPGLVS